MILVVDGSAVRLVFRAQNLTVIRRFLRRSVVADAVAFVGNVAEFRTTLRRNVLVINETETSGMVA